LLCSTPVRTGVPSTAMMFSFSSSFLKAGLCEGPHVGPGTIELHKRTRPRSAESGARCGDQWKQHAASVNLHNLLLDVLVIVIKMRQRQYIRAAYGQINGAAHAEASPSRMTMLPSAKHLVFGQTFHHH